MAGMCESGGENGFLVCKVPSSHRRRNSPIWSGDADPKVRVGLVYLTSSARADFSETLTSLILCPLLGCANPNFSRKAALLPELRSSALVSIPAEFLVESRVPHSRTGSPRMLGFHGNRT